MAWRGLALPGESLQYMNFQLRKAYGNFYFDAIIYSYTKPTNLLANPGVGQARPGQV